MGDSAATERSDPAEALRTAFEPAAIIEALDLVGVDRELVGTATGADDRTIRRWAQASSKPRSAAWDVLDRIRIIALYMLQREAMPPKYIGPWLKARNLELGMDPTIGVRRPVDAIREDDLPAVFAAINTLIRAPAAVAGFDAGSDDLGTTTPTKTPAGKPDRRRRPKNGPGKPRDGDADGDEAIAGNGTIRR